MMLRDAKKNTILALFGVALSFCVLSLDSKEPQSRSKNGEPIKVEVMVQKVQCRVTYKVESKPVGDLLRAFGQLVEQRGEDYPVIVLIDWNAPVSQLFEVERTASKAGFKSIRSFVSDSDKTYMSEIKISKGIPYTTDPHQN
jgi:biopolymer transport protein ExbD